MKEAVSVGAESVSQVFVRGKGGKIEDDEDDDQYDDGPNMPSPYDRPMPRMLGAHPLQ